MIKLYKGNFRNIFDELLSCLIMYFTSMYIDKDKLFILNKCL